MSYQDWIGNKSRTANAAGFDVEPSTLNPALFHYQRDLVTWALSRGRAALFADTGLGKTLMQVSWAHEVASRFGRVLILAPLAVANQTVAEAERFGVDCTYARQDDGHAITVTNYEMLDRFDPRDFAGVVLDESSILKSFNGKTRNAIITAFGATPYRLACTATPAPNDHTELGNHAEFLGVLSRVEMLAEYFIHDAAKTQDWRLKGHARQLFWQWVCSWAAVIRRPSDMGYSDEGFELPPLREESMHFASGVGRAHAQGLLLPVGSSGLNDQRAARKATMPQRVQLIAEHIEAEPGRPALVWCEMNAESDALVEAIPDAVQVRGSDAPEVKAAALLDFAAGRLRVLVTKPSIAGFGMNWQHCDRVYFVGPSHSYEQTYQAIRRCWRFGQPNPVMVRTCTSDEDAVIVANARRKAADAERMGARLVAQVNESSYQTGAGARRQWDNYEPSQPMELPQWLMSA